MGNEGSVPQTEEEFEHQARAPPSSTNPPLPNPQPSGRVGGSRMMNAVFHRRQNQNHDRTQETMASYPPVALTPEDTIIMTPEEQHYHQQKLYQIHQQQQAQQQQQLMAANPYYAQQPQPYPPAMPQPPAANEVYQNSNGTNPSPPKRTFRPSGRNIINSMKNLSLRGIQSSPSRQAAKAESVNDWETKWDEDEDEDDSDDEEIQPKTPQHFSAQPTPMAAAPPVTDSTPIVTPEPQVPKPVSEVSTDDGVEWDTGVHPVSGDHEKPNVQMFLPLLRVLGKGSFGKVVLVQKQAGNEKGNLFAMKILRKSHLVRRRQIERTRTERKVLSVVNHPFIMKLHYAFQSPEKLYLVLDYCPGGELFFHLSRFRRFPERVARFYAAELLLALGHLHKRGIIYRDLKPENVLLDADGHVKLGDFGLAKAGIQHPCEGATSMCGTPEYMAPEILAQQGHGFCVDYWGLGMLVYEMMTGLPPWYTTDRTRLFRRLRSAPLDIPTYFSQSSANCVSALLERNPKRRLGVTGIRAAMEHEFFRSISWRALYGRRVEAPIRPCEGWNPPSADEPKKSESEPQNNINSNDLDAATANFDNTFTRMPVDTDHNPDADEGEMEELHEDTFLGFTFDDKDRDEPSRARTQHYPQQQPQVVSTAQPHHID